MGGGICSLCLCGKEGGFWIYDIATLRIASRKVIGSSIHHAPRYKKHAGIKQSINIKDTPIPHIRRYPPLLILGRNHDLIVIQITP
jgi:hypothetical protein